MKLLNKLKERTSNRILSKKISEKKLEYKSLINYLLSIYYNDYKKKYSKKEIADKSGISIDIVEEVIGSLKRQSFLVGNVSKEFTIKYEGIIWLSESRSSMDNYVFGAMSIVSALFVIILALADLYSGTTRYMIILFAIYGALWLANKLMSQ